VSGFTLGLICARGGSKGLPGKNVRRVARHPLIAYTIAVARGCQSLDRVVVSTDDDEIAAVARRYGAVVLMRPARLARDDTAKLPVLRHAVGAVERELGLRVELVVDLQVTSPVRTVGDIERCLRAVRKPATDVALTVARARNNPYYDLIEERRGYLVTSKRPPRVITRRQDAPPVYVVTGSVYAYRRDYLMAEGADVLGRRTRGVIVPEERSLDVDTALDLKLLELLVREGIASLPAIPGR
jgi:CMP-N,N'-diacetyllegionaminic acid synthase